MPGRIYSFRRRVNWTREEWLLAYDVCPKVNQSYGPEAPSVRELADLLGRTPAAVSRAFGNLWAAQTNGRRGLKNRSHLADEIVAEYRDNPARLYEEALILRHQRIPAVFTPRLELVSPEAESPLPSEVVDSAARDSGLPSEFYFVTTRTGSTIVDVGILLDGLIVGTTGWLAVINTIQLIRDYLRRRHEGEPRPTLEIVNRSWKDVEDGQIGRVEERVVRVYLPEARVRRLSSDARTRLTGFFSFLKGVRRETPGRTPEVRIGHAKASRGRSLSRQSLERILRIDLSSVPEEVLKQLGDVVKAARTTEFESALRVTRRAARSSQSPARSPRS